MRVGRSEQELISNRGLLCYRFGHPMLYHSVLNRLWLDLVQSLLVARLQLLWRVSLMRVVHVQLLRGTWAIMWY
jgi:hypothetical protein